MIVSINKTIADILAGVAIAASWFTNEHLAWIGTALGILYVGMNMYTWLFVSKGWKSRG